MHFSADPELAALVPLGLDGFLGFEDGRFLGAVLTVHPAAGPVTVHTAEPAPSA